MSEPDRINDVFLQPGELYFGGWQTRIRTLLGSCVSLVFWHPGQKLGGMCHFMLPARKSKANETPDGRYADEAVELLLADIRKSDTKPADYRVKMFGGGNMFPELAWETRCHIGAQNVQAARALLAQHGLECESAHVEGHGHRHLIFNVWDGSVLVRHQPLLPQRSRCSPALTTIPDGPRTVAST